MTPRTFQRFAVRFTIHREMGVIVGTADAETAEAVARNLLLWELSGGFVRPEDIVATRVEPAEEAGR